MTRDWHSGFRAPFEVRPGLPTTLPRQIQAAFARARHSDDHLPDDAALEVAAFTRGIADEEKPQIAASRCLLAGLGARQRKLIVTPMANGVVCTLTGLSSWVTEPFAGPAAWRVLYEGALDKGFVVTLVGIVADHVEGMAVETLNGWESVRYEGGALFHESTWPELEPFPIKRLRATDARGREEYELLDRLADNGS